MGTKPKLTIGQYSEAGRKEANDDSYGVTIPEAPLIETKGVAMAIADGVSSCAGAKEASESCIKSFLDDYYGTHESWTVTTSVGRILSALNRWLYGQGQARTASGRGGLVTTFSGLILKSATAHLFHVGDSRIYHLRDETLEQLTSDHRVYMAKGKEYLGRAMGADLHVEIDCSSLAVSAGDVFIFTTDGVHDYIAEKDMVGLVRDYTDNLGAAAHEIVKTAHDNDSPDNLTCQIVRIDDPGVEDEAGHYKRLQALPFPPDLEPGHILDGYRILRELHASNRTQVYLAEDEETGEKVVIKTPSINFVDDPVYLEMFTREEWVGRRLSSPHVLKIVEQKRRRRFLYYLAEYVEGETLRQWMDAHPRPQLSDVRPIIEQLARGLRAFHRREMIHQDIKPENIVIDKAGTVKIIDFGSTKIAGLGEVATLLKNSGPLGTRGYTAPEYFLNEPGSNRSDIFSLGAIAYEMLTGALPYGDGFSSRRAVAKASYTPANFHAPDIPDWVDAALAKALNIHPSRRYGTLSEFLADLDRPNPGFLGLKSRPLIERNPVAFWKAVALLMFGLSIFLLIWNRV